MQRSEPAPDHRPPTRRRAVRTAAIGTAIAALLCAYLIVVVSRANAAEILLSQGRPVVASSTENAGTVAANAVDGNTGTRWSSAFSVPQWIYVDLGSAQPVTRVALNWEA